MERYRFQDKIYIAHFQQANTKYMILTDSTSVNLKKFSLNKIQAKS